MTTITLLLLLASSGTLVTTTNPFQIPKDAEYEIVLNAEHIAFNTPESVSIQYSIRNLAATKLPVPEIVWGSALVWDGKACKRNPTHNVSWNGIAEIFPKGYWCSVFSLDDYLVPANLLTPGRHTIALKHASTESNTQTIFIEKTDIPQGLLERKGSEIVAAPPEDLALARTYPSFKYKGKVLAGQRITILTQRTRYKVGESVRVLHVLEAVEPGKGVHVMGPKTIYYECMDGKLLTEEGPGKDPYRGMVIDIPLADFNYDITTYTFKEPGAHTIQWKGGGASVQGHLGLESNIIRLEVVEH